MKNRLGPHLYYERSCPIACFTANPALVEDKDWVNKKRVDADILIKTLHEGRKSRNRDTAVLKNIRVEGIYSFKKETRHGADTISQIMSIGCGSLACVGGGCMVPAAPWRVVSSRARRSAGWTVVPRSSSSCSSSKRVSSSFVVRQSHLTPARFHHPQKRPRPSA